MTYLNEPWLELVINNDVVPITLKTVLVIVHHRLWNRTKNLLGEQLTCRWLWHIGNFFVQQKKNDSFRKIIITVGRGLRRKFNISLRKLKCALRSVHFRAKRYKYIWHNIRGFCGCVSSSVIPELNNPGTRLLAWLLISPPLLTLAVQGSKCFILTRNFCP